MGSQNSKFLSQQQLPHQYRPLKQLPGVYESILNGTRLQKHKIQVNSEGQINYQKDVFIFRRMNADRIISAYFFQKFTPHHMCNLSYQVCYFTEYPDYAMSLNLVIPFQRGFQLLIECLKGFQLLFYKFGVFPIGFENIFFDNHNQPKVWISADFGKTRVENKDKININEQKMVMQIFRIFDQIKDERNSRQTFSNYLKRMQQKDKIINFKNVLNYMIEEGSKFFISRSKSISLFKQAPFYNPHGQKQKQLKQMRNNSSFLGLQHGEAKQKLNKQKQKQKQTNAMSLKVKNKNNSRNSHHNQVTRKNSHNSQNDQNINNLIRNPSFPVNNQIQFNCSGKLSEFTRQTLTNNNSNGFGNIVYSQSNYNLDKQRKNRRHNSQQDYKSRQLIQLDLIKQNYCNFNNTTNATIPTSIYQQKNLNNASNIQSNSQNLHTYPYKQLMKNKSSFNFDQINQRNSHNGHLPFTNNNSNNNYHFTIKPSQYKKTDNFPIYTHTPNRAYRKSLDQLHNFLIIQHGQHFTNTKRYQIENNNRQLNRHYPQYIQRQKYLDKITHTEFQQSKYMDNNNRLKNNKSFDYDFMAFQDMRPTVSPSFGNRKPQLNRGQKQGEFQRLKYKQKQRQKQKQKKVNFSDKMMQMPRQSCTKLSKTRHKISDKRIETHQNERSPITILKTEQNQSHMILNNLQTFKSIINSQYSDMDSQIRFDLQNFIL